MAIVFGLLLLACPGSADTAEPDTGCETEGDIDDVRFSMVRQTCSWMLLDCGVADKARLEDCIFSLADDLIPPVDEGQCIDWCQARDYAATIRDRDCSQAPVPVDFYDWPSELLLESFYTCDSPNYEPSGP